MSKIKIFIYLIITCVTSNVFAEIRPISSKYDRRIQAVKYNPANVVKVNVKLGITTLIQLQEGETITDDDSGMGFGDPLAWNVNVRENNIFIRPIADQPDTNVALVTNKRTYILNLHSVEENNQVTWYLRYMYEDDIKEMQKENVENKLKMSLDLAKSKSLPCNSRKDINIDYFKKGDNSISPLKVWDDGLFTCMQFYITTGLPVVFKQLNDKSETLTNYHMDDDIMVIHEVAESFILRLGDDVLNLRTLKKLNQGYNNDGTTSGEVRVIK